MDVSKGIQGISAVLSTRGSKNLRAKFDCIIPKLEEDSFQMTESSKHVMTPPNAPRRYPAISQHMMKRKPKFDTTGINDKPSTKQSIRQIIEKCSIANYTDQQVETAYKRDYEKEQKQTKQVSEKIGLELTKNKIKLNKTIETANKINSFSDNLPVILKAIFEEDQNRRKDQSEDEVKVLQQFETRKLNIGYNIIIKNAEKTKL